MKKLRKISIFMCVVMAVTAIMSTPAFAARGSSHSQNGWNWDNYDSSWGSKADLSKVAFYIQLNGELMDSDGNITRRDVKDFTDSVGETTVAQTLNSSFQKTWSIEEGNSDITDYVTELPDEDDAFEVVVEKYDGTDAYIRSSDGKVVPWTRMNSKYYYLHWYVLKAEDDFWHVDGVIVDRATNEEIQIVVPDKDAERAACVEYDVKAGTFTPGFMEVKANRPHAYWEGDNNNKVMDGYNDVWYTVLDEETFESNNAVIPSDLINAAQAVAQLAGARLTELDTRLQKEYGRIDSQAYKQEYIERTGSGKTLYVTPFITEMLSEKYGVDRDEYVWLAMGDSHGSIEKVYVMDRDMAGIDNMFDNE